MKTKATLKQALFGRKVAGTRVVPISVKIILFFTLFILLSNLSTNYINLMYNRTEMILLLKELLIKDLRELNTFCNNQYQIYQFNKDLNSSLDTIRKKALFEFKNEKSLAFGISTNGQMAFSASKHLSQGFFEIRTNMRQRLLADFKTGKSTGVKTLTVGSEQYLAVYRYHEQWGFYLVRGEELNEFYSKSNQIFVRVSLISIGITLLTALIGIWILKHILRYVQIITNSIIKMTREQQLGIIDLQGASNDDITFLGVAFNSLSSTINNMIKIFRKFVNRDVALQAYREKEVRLEGQTKELTCLFSDIRQFTHMTEQLGSEIITLLNLHYDRAIREILDKDGIIGSIIGDALLAVFGALDEAPENKSVLSIQAAYKIQEVAASLRQKMTQIKKEVESQAGRFSKAELEVYRAVLIEVGVGIDGGDVFYGNIGSSERMTNTVIGDNVNSASRLEGLTRIYEVPVVCSEYIKKEVEAEQDEPDWYFMELDKVQVKGKTQGKRIYWPIPSADMTKRLKEKVKLFEDALQLYYKGDWNKAGKLFSECSLPPAAVFVRRTQNRCPQKWNGIWTMKTK